MRTNFISSWTFEDFELQEALFYFSALAFEEIKLATNPPYESIFLLEVTVEVRFYFPGDHNKPKPTLNQRHIATTLESFHLRSYFAIVRFWLFVYKRYIVTIVTDNDRRCKRWWDPRTDPRFTDVSLRLRHRWRSDRCGTPPMTSLLMLWRRCIARRWLPRFNNANSQRQQVDGRRSRGPPRHLHLRRPTRQTMPRRWRNNARRTPRDTSSSLSTTSHPRICPERSS